jgi:DNA repair protein RadC
MKNQDPPPYATDDDRIIARALEILAIRHAPGTALTSPAQVKDYLTLKLAPIQHEVFGVLFLTSQHAVIAFEEMFRGTLSQTSVYPREVVKRALELNAGAVIFSHNHPSGSPEPSRADEHLTQVLKAALALVDVRVLDHLVVATSGCVSFAERGLI